MEHGQSETVKRSSRMILRMKEGGECGSVGNAGTLIAMDIFFYLFLSLI